MSSGYALIMTYQTELVGKSGVRLCREVPSFIASLWCYRHYPRLL